MKNPFRFVVEKENGDIIHMVPGKLVIKDRKPSRVSWRVLNTSEELDLECTGQMEFDGFID